MTRTLKRTDSLSQLFRLFAVLMAACIIPACYHKHDNSIPSEPPAANDDAVVTVEDVAIASLLTGTDLNGHDLTFELGNSDLHRKSATWVTTFCGSCCRIIATSKTIRTTTPKASTAADPTSTLTRTIYPWCAVSNGPEIRLPTLCCA